MRRAFARSTATSNGQREAQKIEKASRLWIYLPPLARGSGSRDRFALCNSSPPGSSPGSSGGAVFQMFDARQVGFVPTILGRTAGESCAILCRSILPVKVGPSQHRRSRSSQEDENAEASNSRMP